MPWMLQPKNWEQARHPNLYNVNYGRVGTYKGMGQDSQTIPESLYNLPLQTDIYSKIANLSYNPATLKVSWFNQYGTYVIVGVGVLLLMGAMRRR